MRIATILGCLGLLLATCQLGNGAPVKGAYVKQGQVEPNGSQTFVDMFKEGERAVVIITGEGTSYLGLYVYDADGNCIARDDRSNYATRDDAAVEWFPPRTARYTIEVKNLGGRSDVFAIAVR